MSLCWQCGDDGVSGAGCVRAVTGGEVGVGGYGGLDWGRGPVCLYNVVVVFVVGGGVCHRW